MHFRLKEKKNCFATVDNTLFYLRRDNSLNVRYLNMLNIVIFIRSLRIYANLL